METQNRIDQTEQPAPQQQLSITSFTDAEHTVPSFDPLMYISAVGLASFLALEMMVPF
jgi:hypothetical protein